MIIFYQPGHRDCCAAFKAGCSNPCNVRLHQPINYCNMFPAVLHSNSLTARDVLLLGPSVLVPLQYIQL